MWRPIPKEEVRENCAVCVPLQTQDATLLKIMNYIVKLNKNQGAFFIE